MCGWCCAFTLPYTLINKVLTLLISWDSSNGFLKSQSASTVIMLCASLCRATVTAHGLCLETRTRECIWQWFYTAGILDPYSTNSKLIHIVVQSHLIPNCHSSYCTIRMIVPLYYSAKIISMFFLASFVSCVRIRRYAWYTNRITELKTWKYPSNGLSLCQNKCDCKPTQRNVS